MNLGFNKISFGCGETQAHKDFRARQSKRHARNAEINDRLLDEGKSSQAEHDHFQKINDDCYFDRMA